VEAAVEHGNPVQANEVVRVIEMIEIQGRGPPHSHLLIWSKDLPT